MNPSPSSLSPSSFSKRKRDPNSLDKSIKHDFFLNYSDDIRNGFISHVKGGFDRNGFTISDHTELPVGQSVRSELLKAIEGSQIFVIVFSINYGFSVRCLDELVNIMLCFGKSDEKKLLPVFFNVDPSDVRNQEGPFKEAFKAHNTNFDGPRVQKWRRALNDVGQLSGAHYQNGDEESFICKMVQKLQSMHNPPIQYERNCLVGIESREEELISSLRLDSNDPSIVAVLGISGIGKTTIANAVFNKIAAKFDVSCFLEVIHYDFENPDLMLKMQKKLIHRLSQNDKLPMIHNHFEGAAKIKMLLRGRKVLLVLDDLDNVKQWEAFGIDDPYNTISLNECLGDGSRIIVTTRDIQSLGSLPYVSYNTSLLNITESIELLTQLIYEEGEPIDMNFVEEIASCASGLPLVIEVWSRYFRSLERKQWPDALKRLKKIPHDDVHKKLKISYNSLSNRAKKLFLDIACVFDGMDLKLIVKVLQDNNEDMAFFWDQEIRCLAHKGLVIISSRLHTRVLMHHAIREMGQEIVRQENEDEPGQRTRLTNHKDVLRVLKDFSGTQSVESIHQGHMTGHIDAFRNMNNLRLIRLDDVALCSVPRIPFGCDCEDMSPLCFPMLKYLEWVVFPLESINIDMCNVVVVRLPHSRLEALWKEPKCLEKLKILDVGDSLLLTKPGNFNGLKNLEYLHFNGCKNLEELDSSLWCLDKLVILDLHCCSRLKRFPSKMEGKLRSLQVLDLSECVSIGFEYDEVIKHFMSSLKETHITRLMLSGCNIYKVPSEVGSLTWLKHLDLGLNYFHSLPDSLVKVDQLETIDLSDCYSLQSIPYLPRSICSVIARNCGCLTSLPLNMAELTSLEELHLRGCSKLGIEDPDCLLKLTGLTSLTILKMAKCNVSQVPNEIGNLVSLHTLNLSENTFSSFPDSFGNLLQLRELSIWNCSNLTYIASVTSTIINKDRSNRVLVIGCYAVRFSGDR